MSLYYEQDNEIATGKAVSLDINQDWIKSLCLAAVLTVLLFIMGLAIALVATRPLPVIPESNTVAPRNGPALAESVSRPDFMNTTLS